MRFEKWFADFVLSALCVIALGFVSTQANAADEAKWTNSIGMEFVRISAGSFTMGADREVEKEADSDETPQHYVTISQPFYLGKYEVTQAQWTAVMGSNPSKFKERSNPVEQVSWNDAQKFIRRLNRKEKTDKYRLPTEVEWEYAARAGTTSAWSFGGDASSAGQYAWYRDNSEERPHPVGQKPPNPWGLHDMHGNVWEWVQDWYESSPNPSANPSGPARGSHRVLRGGSWGNTPEDLRSANRFYFTPDYRYVYLGFRLAFSADHP